MSLRAPFIYAGSFLFVLTTIPIPLATDRVQPGWDVGIGFDIVNFIQISGGYRFGLGNAVNSWALQHGAGAPDKWLECGRYYPL